MYCRRTCGLAGMAGLKGREVDECREEQGWLCRGVEVAPFVFPRWARTGEWEVISTADGDSVTCNGQSSDSSALTGTISTPDGFYFDAQAEKDTTVTIRNAFT